MAEIELTVMTQPLAQRRSRPVQHVALRYSQSLYDLGMTGPAHVVENQNLAPAVGQRQHHEVAQIGPIGGKIEVGHGAFSFSPKRTGLALSLIGRTSRRDRYLGCDKFLYFEIYRNNRTQFTF